MSTRASPRACPRAATGSTSGRAPATAAAARVQEEYPLDRFPLFVRAGSIVPMGPVLQYVNEQPKALIEIRVYPGRDASFTLYEDDGDSYAYERGQRATVLLRWDDAKRQLQVAAREGSFPWPCSTAPTSGPPDAGHREIQTRARAHRDVSGPSPDTAVPLKARRTTHKHSPGDNSCASPSHPAGPFARAARAVRLRRPAGDGLLASRRRE